MILSSAASPAHRVRCALAVLALCVALLSAAPASHAAPTGEVEPNNRISTAQQITLPVYSYDERGGRIGSPGDVDFYGFDVPAGHAIYARVYPYGAQTLDPFISLHRASGATLDARTSNGNTLAAYVRTAGRYYLRIAHASPSASGHQYTLEVFTGSYPPEQTGWSPTPFHPAQWYDIHPEDNWPDATAIEIADVSGDGRGEVLVASQYATTDAHPALYVYPARANGSLGKPRRWLLPVAPADSPDVNMGVDAGDVIGDAGRDVAVGAVPGVYLFEQRDGVLVRGPLVRTPYAVNEVCILDIDRDGRRDLVANTTRGVIVIRATAAGFAPARRVVALGQIHLQVADVIGDGGLDLVGIRGDGYARVYRQRSDGTFAPPSMLVVQASDYGFTGTDGVVVTDATGDGKRDVIVQNYRHLNLFARTGTGWSKARVMRVGEITPIREAADVSGDWRAELVGTSALVFLDADGWVNRTLYLSGEGGYGPDITALGDIDGDGASDLAATGSEGPIVFRGGFTP